MRVTMTEETGWEREVAKYNVQKCEQASNCLLNF